VGNSYTREEGERKQKEINPYHIVLFLFLFCLSLMYMLAVKTISSIFMIERIIAPSFESSGVRINS
jgi:hypothetical protein